MEQEVEQKSKNSSMVYVVSGLLLILVIGAGLYFMNKGNQARNTPEEIVENPVQKPTTTSGGSLSGQKFSDTELANAAVQIYPGAISESARVIMSGWNLKTKTLPDGTIKADLIPTGSEATEGDSAHTFILKTGDKLYFVDLNPGDDQPGMDNNKNDDLGIVVDANGIIQ